VQPRTGAAVKDSTGGAEQMAYPSSCHASGGYQHIKTEELHMQARVHTEAVRDGNGCSITAAGIAGV
jgi:hypothetical protein